MAIEYINGSEPYENEEVKTQVFKDTHIMAEGRAWKRSPLMKRSFISFAYGGKKIEDFNLIATIHEDRMRKPLYAEFEDITTTYDVLDGQFYWDTRFETNQIDFVLATDGITEEQLNDFKYWFKPGVSRELVLAEAPNRAIMARVMNVPQYSVIPFEHKTSLKIGNLEYPTSVTLYRGEISLSFTSDDPHWYARNNYLDYYYTDIENKFGSITDQHSNDATLTLNDPDMIKVIIEDHIPHRNMFVGGNIMLGNNEFVDLNRSIVGSVNNTTSINGNLVAAVDIPTTTTVEGVVGIVKNSGVTIGSDQISYLFYSGTAPSKPKITFTLNPVIQVGKHYIAYPLNSYSKLDYPSEKNEYSTLFIGDTKLKFSLPSIYLGFNEAKNIVQTHPDTNGRVMRELFRDNIHDYYARAWAMACLTGLDDSIVGFDGFSTRMNYFVMQGTDPNTYYSHATFTFDSESGQCYSTITIRMPKSNISFTSSNAPANGSSEIIEVVENTGDMMRSGYPIIDQRCYFDSTNHITTSQCLVVRTDYPGPTDFPGQDGLTNLTIEYKNMYL